MDDGIALSHAKEIRSLTGLRGLAALFVVIFHEAGNFKASNPLQVFLQHGYNAVDLFFVLSGFVMALTYSRNIHSARGYIAFLGKRIARIYPLYFIATLATFSLVKAGAIHSGGISAETLLLNLAMLQAWWFAPSIVLPAWSISTEWAAYLLFPLLSAYALARNRWKPCLLLVAAVSALIEIAVLSGPAFTGNQTEWFGSLDLFGVGTVAPVIRCVAGFSLGLLAYRVAHLVSYRWAPLCAALALFSLLFPSTDVLFVLLCTPFVASLSADRGPVARLLASPPIYALGVWSYSIYILHARFGSVRLGFAHLLDKLHSPAPEPTAIVLTTGVIVICAALTYRLIEKPGRMLLRRAFSGQCSAVIA